MKKVFSYLKPYRLAIGIAWSLMLIELVVELLHPLFMSKIIDEGILTKNLHVVLVWGGIMIGMSLLSFISGITNTFYAGHVSQNFSYDLREKLFDKVQSFSFANFNRFPTSSLVTRLTNDVTQVQNMIFMAMRVMLRSPLLVVFGTVMAFVVNAKLAMLFIICVPILVVFFLWIMSKGRTLFKTVQTRLDRVNNVLQENLAGVRLIKAFLRGKHEEERFNKVNIQLKDKTLYTFRLIESTMPILLLVMNLAIVLILWNGYGDVLAKDVKVGEVVAIINYGTRITGAISMLSWLVMAFARARASAGRIEEVLEAEIDLRDTEEMDQILQVEDGKIEFKQVDFKYPETNQVVLKNISFVVDAQETIAILGETGSGKSSLFQLIPRLYDTNNGQVLIDNHDVKTISLKHLRTRIGFVPQEVILFTGTIKENIAWGKEGATMEDIVGAAKHAQIHDAIMNLPKQYDTMVGQKGVNLSGGQKQRISIARALVRNPKILLLDDSTSALDLKTEAKLLKALKTYKNTTLIITQKISTAMEADKILILDDGKLLASGTHEELLVHSTLYQSIYQSQFGEGGMEHA